MLYYFRHALAVYMESVLSHRRLSFLVCLNFLWPCSLIETSDRVKWDSPITKWSFIFSLGVRKWSGEKLLYARRAPRSARNDIRSSIWSLGVRSRCRSRKWRLTWPCCRRKKRSANWLCCRWRKRPAISISANESLIGCVPSIRLADWLSRNNRHPRSAVRNGLCECTNRQTYANSTLVKISMLPRLMVSAAINKGT